MKRVMWAVLAMLAPAPVSAETLSIADVLIDLRDLRGKTVTVACNVVAMGADIVYCMGEISETTSLMIELEGASREDRKFVLTECAKVSFPQMGCKAEVTGTVDDWMGSGVAVLTKPSFRAVR